jgi:mRNA interferase RelE/StbE
MACKLLIEDRARKEFDELDKPLRKRVGELFERLETLDDLRNAGKALTANLKGLWSYRAGNVRILARIKDSELVILAVKIGVRKDVYGE